MAHERWLKQELMKALSWDDMIVDGVVDVISKADSADDEHVQDIVQNFMENSPVAIGIIADYMEAKRGNTKQQQQQQRQHAVPRQATPVIPPAPQQQQQRASYSTSVAAAAKPSPVQRAAAVKQEKDKWLNLGGQQQQQAEPVGEAGQDTAASKSSAKETAEATLAMFKRGGRIQTRPKPSEAAAAGGGSGSNGPAGSQRKGGGSQLEQLTAGLERKVANCLSCGKIFNCRNLTNDIIAFIHGKFACTFCGAQVAMTQQQRIAQAQQPPHSNSSSDTTAAAAGAGDAAAADDDATAKAIAFKDRLVDYDRHSQKRTTVIDDQSDYFEIDTNAWLSEEERAELKRRAEAEEAAAAARRNRVTVTLDLLGRKVLMAEGADGSAAGSSSGASFQTMSATEALRQGVDVITAAGGAGAGAAAAAAAAGGDAAAAGAGGDQGPSAAEALEQALAAIRDLRISVNPTISTPPPVFVPVRQTQQQAKQHQQQQHGSSSQADKKQQQRSQKGKQQQQQDSAGSSSQPKQKQGNSSAGMQRRGGAAARAAAADARVQDDSIFTEFEAELLFDERLGNSSNSKQKQQQVKQSAVPAS